MLFCSLLPITRGSLGTRLSFLYCLCERELGDKAYIDVSWSQNVGEGRGDGGRW